MFAQIDHQPLGDEIATLRRYARVLTAQPAKADALVAECLARALKRLPSWRRLKDVRLFLFTMMHEAYAESANRQAGNGDDASKQAQAGGAPRRRQGPLPRGTHPLHAALQRLPDAHRETLLLLSLEGMTYHQVSDVMNVPIATVMSRLCHGRRLLWHEMHGAGNDGICVSGGEFYRRFNANRIN